MAAQDAVDHVGPRRRLPLILAIGTVVAASAAVVLLVSAQQNRRQISPALVRFDSITEPHDGVRPLEDFNTYKRTQATLLRSDFVLRAALRKPEVSRLPIVQAHEDPLDWLQRELIVQFPGDAEIMTIGMNGGDHEQLAKVVNAVVQTYFNEVVYAERDEALRRRDQLQEALDKYKLQLRKKLGELHQIEQEIGGAKDGNNTKQQVAKHEVEAQLQRRDRTRQRIDEIELQLLKAAPEKPDAQSSKQRTLLQVEREALEARLKLLDKKLDAKVAAVDRLKPFSLDLIAGQAEVRELETLVARMEKQLRLWDLRLQSPPRVRLIQEATL